MNEIGDSQQQDFLRIEAEMAEIKGLSFQDFSKVCAIPSCTTAFQSIDFVRKLVESKNKEVRYVGMGNDSIISAYSYAIMLIAKQQKRFYPHLRSLVKQQFYRSDVFEEYSEEDQNKLKRLCEIFCGEVDAGKNEEFLDTNVIMLNACQSILKTIIKMRQNVKNYQLTVEFLSKRFNIDHERISLPGMHSQIWKLGKDGVVYIVLEDEHIFTIASIANIFTQSQLPEYRMDSEREADELSNPVIIEASEESTPKFKENLQSIRYRQRSHKNSFGGDFEIGNYRQLAAFLNKKNPPPQSKIVHSERFAAQEMGDLEGSHENLQEEQLSEEEQKKAENNNSEKNNSDNKINNNNELASRESSPNKVYRVRKNNQITSSEIFNIHKARMVESSKIEESVESLETPNFNEKMKLNFVKKDHERFILNSIIDVGASNQLMPKIVEEIQSSQQEDATEKKSEFGEENLSHSFQTSSHQESSEANKNQEGINKNFLKKNRKFSYLTQPFISEGYKKIMESRELEKSYNNMHERKQKEKAKDSKAQKIHKNSEAVTEAKYMRRFQENAINFSQIINNEQHSHFSERPSLNEKNERKQQNSLHIVEKVIEFNHDRFLDEPEGWTQKEITYYFADKNPEKRLLSRVNSYADVRSHKIELNMNSNNSKFAQQQTNPFVRSTMDSGQTPHIKSQHFFGSSNKKKGQSQLSIMLGTGIDEENKQVIPKFLRDKFQESSTAKKEMGLMSSTSMNNLRQVPHHHQQLEGFSQNAQKSHLCLLRGAGMATSPCSKAKVKFNYISTTVGSPFPLNQRMGQNLEMPRFSMYQRR